MEMEHNIMLEKKKKMKNEKRRKIEEYCKTENGIQSTEYLGINNVVSSLLTIHFSGGKKKELEKNGSRSFTMASLCPFASISRLAWVAKPCTEYGANGYRWIYSVKLCQPILFLAFFTFLEHRLPRPPGGFSCITILLHTIFFFFTSSPFPPMGSFQSPESSKEKSSEIDCS